MEQRPGPLGGFPEGVEPLVVPAQEQLFPGLHEIRNVDVDVRLLADPVQTPDALLEQVGVLGDVEEHQVMGELEVAPFASDLGAQEHLRPICLRKVGRLTVPGHEGQVRMEHGHFGARQGFLQVLLHGQDFFLGLADQQDLLVGHAGQEFPEPQGPQLESGTQPLIVLHFIHFVEL